MTTAISGCPVPPLEALHKDIRTRILATQEMAGFVPSVCETLAHRPAEFRAFLTCRNECFARCWPSFATTWVEDIGAAQGEYP